jgi:hypothetical protein
MHDSDYEAMMCKGRITSQPIPQPAQTVETCSKKIVLSTSERKGSGKYLRSGNKRMEQQISERINTTFFKW